MQNPWIQLPESDPYVLECDRSQVLNYNRRTSNSHHFVHLSALPEPYLGNPLAPVVILNLNPGHSDDDAAIHANPQFARASRDNLLHTRERYPFYLLDPELPSPGRKWWLSRLREMIEAAGMESVAHHLFVAEYFPYHTTRYAHQRLRVPSQNYTYFLVRQALRRNAYIVFFRGVEPWCRAIPELNGYARSAVVKNVQRPYLSRGNLPCTFAEIASEIRRAA